MKYRIRPSYAWHGGYCVERRPRWLPLWIMCADGVTLNDAKERVRAMMQPPIIVPPWPEEKKP